MAKKQWSFLDQRAFWEAHDRRCFYCSESVRIFAIQIDHVLPERLSEDRPELERILNLLCLPQDFDLNGDQNAAPTCSRCNAKKGGTIDEGFLRYNLTLVARKALRVEECRQEFRQERKTDTHLANVLTDIALSRIPKDALLALLNPPVLPPNSEHLPDSTERPATSTSLDYNEIRRIFGNASTALLGWPQEVSGVWIDRPELAKLENILESNESSVTVLLGPPGSGKSALLARLGTQLRETRVSLLAIKADALPRDISSVEQLEAHFGFPASILDCVRDLSESAPVVLLIDQVDALSELMDRHTSRLSVLLGLVSRLRGLPDVHILLSCREFEFRHDVRLCGLNPASISLADPPWDAVIPTLLAAKLDWSGWSDSARELLRRPQHLSLFVRFLAGEGGSPNLLTYHKMLEAVLTERVGKQQWGISAMGTLEFLAGQMAESEELWIPRVRIPHERNADIEHLVAAEILSQSQDGFRVGFAHQTLFDFVRARSFVANLGVFSEDVLERQDAVFIRPTVWSALTYMREADPVAYLRAVEELWRAKGLRRHLRLLLIEFIGQVEAPLPFERKLGLSVLDDPPLRAKFFTAIGSRAGWYEVLRPRLSDLMTRDEPAASHVAHVLQNALKFASGDVIELLEHNWFPNPTQDSLTIRVLLDVTEWTDRAVRIAESVVRRTAFADWVTRKLTDQIQSCRPNMAPRIVAAELWEALGRAESIEVEIPPPPPEESDLAEQVACRYKFGDPKKKAVERIVSDSGRWYGLTKTAEAAPAEFVRRVWPWILHVATKYAGDQNPGKSSYHEDHIFDELSPRHSGHGSEFSGAIIKALELFASRDSEGFLAFRREHEGSDLMTIHCLVAKGSACLPPTASRENFDYLVSAPRRLEIGSYQDRFFDSKRLIEVTVPNLTERDRSQLEGSIRAFRSSNIDDDADTEDRRRHLKWSRQDRIRLLRAFPPGTLSAESARFLEQEERALPSTPDQDVRFVGAGSIGSPVSGEQLKKASDADLINLFDDVPDASGWDHPRDHRKGGAIQLAREFGKIAGSDRDRAIRLLAQLVPGRHESYAAQALTNLAETDPTDGSLVEAVRSLAERGFVSQAFREDAARCLATIAPKIGGLDETVCAMLESWLVDAADDPAPDQDHTTREPDRRPRSVLIDDTYVEIPSGNYPILHALFLGRVCRIPPDFAGWLDLVGRHLGRPERTTVWRALARHELTFLFPADPVLAAQCVQTLFLAYDKVLCHAAGVRLLARRHPFLSEATVRFCMECWLNGSWADGPQAAAEIAMLRLAHIPDDKFCRAVVDGAIQNIGPHGPQTRIGLAFLAAEIWGHSNTRKIATDVLMALLSYEEPSLLDAWRNVFHRTVPFPCDAQTIRLLDGLLEHPAVLNFQHCLHLIERMAELIRNEFETVRVARVVEAIVSAANAQLGDLRTGWAGRAEMLINLSLTLQRSPETREIGLRIFEQLMDADAYGLPRTLAELDRRNFH